MPEMRITTETFSENALFPRRTLRVGEKAARTPTRAIPIDSTRDQEQVAADSRGINEIYQSVTSERLYKDRRNRKNQTAKNLRRAWRKAADDEISVSFIKHRDVDTLPVVQAQFLVDTVTPYTEILTTPLMPGVAGRVEGNNGTDDPAYQSYKQNVLRFLEQANDRAPEMPVMGVLPPLGWEFIEDLLSVYAAHDIEAFCLNLNRRRITASTQVNVVRPLMQHVANRGLEENVLFYGINLDPGQNDSELGVRPAADITSVGMGLDIVGGRHEAPPLPKEVFEQMEAEQGSEEEPITFRLFDKHRYVYEDIPVGDLPEAFPDDSALDGEYVARRTRASPGNIKYRLQKLVNAEQMALALNEVQQELDHGSAFEHVSSKVGVSPKTISAYNEVRDGFDAGTSQTGLFDF